MGILTDPDTPTLALVQQLIGDETRVPLIETGNYDEGDGARVLLLPNHLVVLVRTAGDDSSVHIPIVTLLTALELQGKAIGN